MPAKNLELLRVTMDETTAFAHVSALNIMLAVMRGDIEYATQYAAEIGPTLPYGEAQDIAMRFAQQTAPAFAYATEAARIAGLPPLDDGVADQNPTLRGA